MTASGSRAGTDSFCGGGGVCASVGRAVAAFLDGSGVLASAVVAREASFRGEGVAGGFGGSDAPAFLSDKDGMAASTCGVSGASFAAGVGQEVGWRSWRDFAFQQRRGVGLGWGSLCSVFSWRGWCRGIMYQERCALGGIGSKSCRVVR